MTARMAVRAVQMGGSMVTVKLKVTTSGQVDGWWCCIDDSDIVVVNGTAIIELEAATEHLFYYWLVGGPGGKIEAILTQGSDTLRKISDTIPSGYSKIGNARFFKTN